jgi:hypothetical protein
MKKQLQQPLEDKILYAEKSEPLWSIWGKIIVVALIFTVMFTTCSKPSLTANQNHKYENKFSRGYVYPSSLFHA